MKFWGKTVISFFILLLISGYSAASEIIKIKSFDNYVLTGKLDVPKGLSKIPALVIFVHGSGPNTYDDHRKLKDKEFNYFDLFADEICKHNAGFFRYNKRGVEIGKTPPMYDSVNMTEYKKCTPMVHIRDIESMIAELKKDERFKDAKIFLLGWSEGTILASLIAERKQVPVNALLLAGYANENLYDILCWQQKHHNILLALDKIFDKPAGAPISREEFNNPPKDEISKKTVKAINFNMFDFDENGILTKEDLEMSLAGTRAAIISEIGNDNYDWMWKHFFRETPLWVKEHTMLEPNKTRLLKLDLPIYIFQGVYDANTPVEGAIDIYNRFNFMKKKNLHVSLFDKGDHDLDYMDYITSGTISDGLKGIFETIRRLTAGETNFDLKPFPRQYDLTKAPPDETERRREAVSSDLITISNLAVKYYKGKNSYAGFTIPIDLTDNQNGTYKIDKVSEKEITISAEGKPVKKAGNYITKMNVVVGPNKMEKMTIVR